jgi:hypothetical protein
MNDANDGERKVRSLRDLPQAIRPPRDLWAGIEARIADDTASRGPSGVQSTSARRGTSARSMHMRWLAVAATIAALAVGVWIGRHVPPSTATGPQIAQIDSNTTRVPVTAPVNEGAQALQAAYLSDPKFRQERAALVKSLEEKLASLPPDSRAKVLSSLATIQKSKQDLESALGKDPTNALLQELLVNTYQDEMRVLTTVHEASDAGKGI